MEDSCHSRRSYIESARRMRTLVDYRPVSNKEVVETDPIQLACVSKSRVVRVHRPQREMEEQFVSITNVPRKFVPRMYSTRNQ